MTNAPQTYDFRRHLCLAEIENEVTTLTAAWAIAAEVLCQVARGEFPHAQGHRPENAPIFWAAQTLFNAGKLRQAERLAYLHRLTTVGC